MIDKKKALDLASTDRWFRYNMPYAIVMLDQNVWLPVNRNYKPLGHQSRDHVDYNHFRAQAMQFARDPRTFKGIWHGEERGLSNLNQLYLYADGPDSRLDYFERFGKLMSLTVKIVK